MKKISVFIFVSVLLLNFGVCFAESFMDAYMKKFSGMTIDEVIAIKGKPTAERNFAGKKIYVWEYSKTIFNPLDKSTEIRKDRNGELYVNNPSPDDKPRTYYCKMTFETDRDNYVKSYKWSGDICSTALYEDKKIAEKNK